MKKRLALMLALVMTASSLVIPLSVYANTSNYVSPVSTVMDGETMYSDNISSFQNYYVEYYTKGIMYALAAPELHIELLYDMSAGQTIKLNLDNAVWFFRNTVGPNLATQYYSDGIEQIVPENYNKAKGTYTPTSQNGIGGVYERASASNEVAYDLIIADVLDYSAVLITKEDGKAGDKIIIPMVSRTTKYGDIYVNIESQSNISGGSIRIASAVPERVDQKEIPKTKISVDYIATGTDVFSINKLVIAEQVTSTIGGTFAVEIVAPEGVRILPDVDNALIKKNDPDALSMKIDDKNVVNVELTGELKWTKGLKTNGVGINDKDKDYTIRYHYPSGTVNYSRVIIEFKDIEKTRVDKLGNIIITGLKLEADEYVPVGDITLKFNNYVNDIIVSESIVAAKKVTFDASAGSSAVKNADVDHYSVEALIALDAFQTKPYIYPVSGSVNPETNVTRADVCKMLFELLADKNKTYLSNFSDLNTDNRNAISFASNNNYVAGYSAGTFNPNKEITRGEMATIIVNVLKLPVGQNEKINLEANHWAYNAISTLVGKGIMSGYPDGSLSPDKLVTKAEAIVMLNRAFQKGDTYTGQVSANDINADHWAYGYVMNALNGK